MNVQVERCPSCGAALTILPNVLQFNCAYCSTPLRVERSGSDLALHMVAQVSESITQSGARTQEAIHAGTYVTQADLRRLQLAQNLSNAQLRLGQIQSEVRTIQRTPQNRVTRQHLAELHAQEKALKNR